MGKRPQYHWKACRPRVSGRSHETNHELSRFNQINKFIVHIHRAFYTDIRELISYIRATMLQTTSPRRALTPLPVNAMASNISSSKDGIATRKREIDEVEDSELPPRAIRMRTVSQRPLGDQETRASLHKVVKYISLSALLIELIIAIG